MKTGNFTVLRPPVLSVKSFMLREPVQMNRFIQVVEGTAFSLVLSTVTSLNKLGCPYTAR